MAHVEEQVTSIVNSVFANSSSVATPFLAIADLLDSTYFPEFPSHAIPQFYALFAINALAGVVALACIVVRVRRQKFFLWYIRDRWITFNTPILYASFCLIYVFAVEVVIWRTIGIYQHKPHYPFMYVARGITWLSLYLAGIFKSYGVFLGARMASSSVTKVSSDRPSLVSVFLAVVFPLAYLICISALHIWATMVCNSSFYRFQRLVRSLHELQVTPALDPRLGILTIAQPLSDFSEDSQRCVTSQKYIFIVWTAWLVLGVFGLGGYAFVMMIMKLRYQIKTLERVHKGARKAEDAEIACGTVEHSSIERSRRLKKALLTVSIYVLCLFGCSLSYLGAAITVLVYGVSVQTNGSHNAIAYLWFLWTFVIFGTPALIFNFFHGLEDGSFIGLGGSGTASTSIKNGWHARARTQSQDSEAKPGDIDIAPLQLMPSNSSAAFTEEKTGEASQQITLSRTSESTSPSQKEHWESKNWPIDTQKPSQWSRTHT